MTTTRFPGTARGTCAMCDQNLAYHAHCQACTALLEPELNEKTICRCGKYHNAPSVKDPRYCRPCMGEEVPTGRPAGEEPSGVEDGEEELSEEQ